MPKKAPRRRHVTVALSTGVAAACVAGLAACGSHSAGANSSGSYAGQTLTVELPPITAHTAEYNEYYKDLATAFKQKTGATLNFELNETTQQSEVQAIQQAAVTHQGPDLLLSAGGSNSLAYDSHAFQVLTPADWTEIGGKNQFYPNQLSMSGPSASQQIAVPMYNVPDAMVYNTKLFKAAGISSPPTTWDQYVQDAEKINDPSKGIYGTAMDPADGEDPWKTLWFMVEQNGGAYISPSLKQATMDSAPVQQAVSFWFDWYTKFHIVNPNSLTWQAPQMEAAFANGDVGEEVVQKASDVPLYEDGKVGTDFAFAPMPKIPYGMSSLPPGGKAPGTFLSADDLLVATYAPMPLALDFFKILLNDKFQLLQYKLTGRLPVTKSAGAQVDKLNPSLNSTFVKDLGTQEPTPFVSAWGTLEGAMSTMATQCASHIASGGSLSSSDISSALQQANNAVQQQLGG
ncbi:MAG: extracellular solute-binding protein [Trebonia sp.]